MARYLLGLLSVAVGWRTVAGYAGQRWAEHGARGPKASPIATITLCNTSIWHTRLLFHSADDSSLSAEKKEVVLPWGSRSSSR